MTPAEVISSIADPLIVANDVTYYARVLGAERADGTWIGWLEFDAPATGEKWRTEQETTQATRAALAYWASGLEPVYLEGAFQRATRSSSVVP